MIKHISVLGGETIKYLAPQKNQNFIDATCGLGGHGKLILEKTGPEGKLLAIDQDAEALEVAEKNLKNFADRVQFVKGNFNNIGLVVRKWSVPKIDGILFDLGISMVQQKDQSRGFSFEGSAELDMRMSHDSQRLSAKDIVNSYSKRDLVRIFRVLGEEPFASSIADKIIYQRTQKPILRTDELVEVIKKAMPPKYRLNRKTHFATATFRALRMEVNSELENLESGLKQARQIISPGGRIVVISFHSLEDRIVKNFFRESEDLEVLTPSPVAPKEKEIKNNPAARSGKLRAARKLGV
jgi:16S rRNA (cytosine1402-N4)-methyltransferase